MKGEWILQASSKEMFQCVLKVHNLKWFTEDPAATCFYRVHRNLSDVYKILRGVNCIEKFGLFLFTCIEDFLKLGSRV